MWSLKRTIQCKKCPFKKGVNPLVDIPNYDYENHLKLVETISNGDISELNSGELKAMACHHSCNESEYYCVGWIHNQLNQGNNIQLRLKMLSCENIEKIKVIGEQHEKFEDTIPSPGP